MYSHRWFLAPSSPRRVTPIVACAGGRYVVRYRPERKFFIDQILAHDARYTLLYAMRPGITSEAAIYNGYTDTIEKMLRRLEMDLDYMQRASVGCDVSIIAQTFFSLLRSNLR